MIHLILLSFLGFSECRPLYGFRRPDGNWTTSYSRGLGMKEMEVRKDCTAAAGAYVDNGEKYVIDKVLLAKKEADEKAMNDKQLVIQEKMNPEKLLQKIDELEAKVKVLEGK